MIDDPQCHPDRWPSEESQTRERERLFEIIRSLSSKKLHEHPEVYAAAREEMLKHCDGQLPAVLDPFAGGGSIPLEASRLGFMAYASDLNPVAVLLNRCNLELAPRWIGYSPINPQYRRQIVGVNSWHGTDGLAADVRYYGGVVLERAKKALGVSYPTAKLSKRGASEANVIAWIWARTVASPIPAARGKHVPLISTYWLSSKKDGEVWLKPVVDKTAGEYHFEVRSGVPKDRGAVSAGTKLGRGAKFRCLLTDEPMEDDHIKDEGKAGRLGFVLLAVVAEGKRGRIYLQGSSEQAHYAEVPRPDGEADEHLSIDPRNIWCVGYGLLRFSQLFTSRQLKAMVALSDLIQAVSADVFIDGIAVGLTSAAAKHYEQAVTTFLALALDRCSDFNNSLCRWSPSNQKVMNLFGRQTIPMVWDFAEANILGESVGSWSTCSGYVADCVEVLTTGSEKGGNASLVDAAQGANDLPKVLISTDPPYYDNISYAGLSDFFYVWLRRTAGKLYPDLFSTLLVPKMPELTASPERFGGNKDKAKEHFEAGFRMAFTSLRENISPHFPLSVYYAFKQDDEESGAVGEDSIVTATVDLTTGWETLLGALISSGFQITATWPVRASQKWRMLSMGTNALASYIVLSCRPRQADAPQTDRRSFMLELKRELPSALKHLQQGNIAPVDFAQAAIGPGMAVYSRYSRILESTGHSMSVRASLSLINQTLTEVLSELEDEFDSDTRWAIPWFEQHGFGEGEFGDAELLSKAKVTSVSGLRQTNIIYSRAGKVRLLRPDELPKTWYPSADRTPTVWEMTHHLLRLYFYEKVGDRATADLLRGFGENAELARDLAYQLFHLAEKKKRSQEAQGYNALVLGWPEISRLARESSSYPPGQSQLFDKE